MANFSYTVDTNPMANSIDSVKHHVDGVTTAVVAMQTAVVIAEENAANHVVQNVNKGFYTLIRSQISQKIARLRSDTDSKAMEMRQQSSALAAIKGRMEKDYMMITRRYTKLFESLNKSLRSRVFELDKPTANLVNKDIAPTSNRVRMLLGTVPVNQTESIGNSQMIAASRTKHIGQKSIDSMHRFIADINNQKQVIGKILNTQQSNSNKHYYIPVVFSESISKSVGQNQLNFYLPQSKNNILNSVLNRDAQTIMFNSLNSLKWVAFDAKDKEQVEREYFKMIEYSSDSVRIKKQMSQLFDSSNLQTIKQ
jgi:hypothetical protein